MLRCGVVKWGISFEGQFWSLFKKPFFATLQLLGNKLSLIERLQGCDIGLAKISVTSFRNLPDKLWISAALHEFKPFKIFNIFSGDISENSKFKSLNLILS